MSKIISFAWTHPALLAGAKTCTRRNWTYYWALGFRDGDLVQAWDRSPRVRSAKRIATIQLTGFPYLESLRDMPDADYYAEGFAWLAEHLTTVPKEHKRDVSWESFEEWRCSDDSLWVVRFKLVDFVRARIWH